MIENNFLPTVQTCQWCLKPNKLLLKYIVCDDCYQRLLIAGMKDDEIFKEIKVE